MKSQFSSVSTGRLDVDCNVLSLLRLRTLSTMTRGEERRPSATPFSFCFNIRLFKAFGSKEDTPLDSVSSVSWLVMDIGGGGGPQNKRINSPTSGM